MSSFTPIATELRTSLHVSNGLPELRAAGIEASLWQPATSAGSASSLKSVLVGVFVIRFGSDSRQEIGKTGESDEGIRSVLPGG